MSDAYLARMETLARRLVVARIESTRDRSLGDTGATTALAELIADGRSPADAQEDLLEVIWFLTFFSAAGDIGKHLPDDFEHPGTPEELDREQWLAACEKAIEEHQKRLLYLATLTEGNS